jgi:hypothetical protein
MKEQELTDSQKMKLIQDNPKLKKKWINLDRKSKEEILKGMDIAVDDKWLLGLFTELKD